ncbi:MAG: DUF3108 domain-containing protein [Bacteroidia bacterium]|nr:DUF3108 domain-containing protein [Bacteroidia bacterium]
MNKKNKNSMLVAGLLLAGSFMWFGNVAMITSIFQEPKSEGVTEDNSNYVYRKLPNTAFQEGEKLNFRVHYGIINAANIQMEVVADNQLFSRPEELKGRKAFHVVVQGSTIKAFDWAFKVRDRFDSWIDEDALAPLKYSKSVLENNYTDQDLVYYRHVSGKLNGKKGNLDIPSYTQDIASALYYARNIEFKNAKVGESFPIDVYLDNEIYNLNFKYLGVETIKSDIGKVKCYKLKPRLVVDRVFKGEDDMTVWISADENKIPIRVQSDIQVGSLKVDLTSYSGLRNNFDAKLKK